MTKDKTKGKQYTLSEEEQIKIKRIISTIGFFTTATQGLYTQLELEKNIIEKRVSVGEDEVAVLDTNDMTLQVKKKDEIGQANKI